MAISNFYTGSLIIVLLNVHLVSAQKSGLEIAGDIGFITVSLAALTQYL
jgi:hypothetical protein